MAKEGVSWLMRSFAAGIGCVLLSFYLFCRWTRHPCGQMGYLVELLPLFYKIEDLNQDTRTCLWGASTVRRMPFNRLSYVKAAWSMVREMRSGDTSTTAISSETVLLEKEVEQYLGVRRARFVSTGTSALVLLMQAAGIGPGDEVIVPTYTWIASASAITATGGVPIMADIDRTLGIDPLLLPSYFTNRTKAVLVVHMQGVPCNVVEIKKVCEQKNVLLLEDNAQAFGSTVFGQRVGTFGAMGFTSVNPSKHFQCGGQGGLVWVGKSEELARRLDVAVGDASQYGSPSGTSSAGSGSGVVPFAMHSLPSPSNWHAAFLRHELTTVDMTIKYLAQLKRAYVTSLHPIVREWLQVVADPFGDRSYQVSFILETEDFARELAGCMNYNGVNTDQGGFWTKHYLPHVGSLMQKVSFHQSGFPWIEEEDKRALQYESYRRSTDIMKRTMMVQLSYYLTEPLVVHAGYITNQCVAYVDGKLSPKVERPPSQEL